MDLCSNSQASQSHFVHIAWHYIQQGENNVKTCLWKSASGLCCLLQLFSLILKFFFEFIKRKFGLNSKRCNLTPLVKLKTVLGRLIWSGDTISEKDVKSCLYCLINKNSLPAVVKSLYLTSNHQSQWYYIFRPHMVNALYSWAGRFCLCYLQSNFVT